MHDKSMIKSEDNGKIIKGKMIKAKDQAVWLR